MITFISWIAPFLIFIILENLALNISSIGFKRVMLIEIENSQYVSAKTPNPLKRVFFLQRILLTGTCVITVIVIFILSYYLKFNPIIVTGIILVYRLISVLRNRNKEASLDAETSNQLRFKLRDDFEKFVKIAFFQSQWELTGLIIGFVLSLIGNSYL